MTLFSILLAILQRARDDLRFLASDATRTAQQATAEADTLDAVIEKLTGEPPAGDPALKAIADRLNAQATEMEAARQT